MGRQARVTFCFGMCVAAWAAAGCSGGSSHAPSVIAPRGPGVPETTKAVNASAIVGTEGDEAGELDVQVSRAVVTDPRGLVAGDILVVGIGPSTPYGLLRKVDEVRDAGDSYVLVTEPAALSDALPQGTIAFSGPSDPGAAAPS